MASAAARGRSVGADLESGPSTNVCAASMGIVTPSQFAGANRSFCGVPLVLYGGP